jgi:hypothetical protein
MRCAICGITVETIDEAVEEGWTPYFYDGEKEHEFACRRCSQAILQVDDNGEMEVREEFRGRINYLDDDREKAGESHLIIGIPASENEAGKVN